MDEYRGVVIRSEQQGEIAGRTPRPCMRIFGAGHLGHDKG